MRVATIAVAALGLRTATDSAAPFSFSLGGTPANLSQWSTTSNSTKLDTVRTLTTVSFDQDPAALIAQLQRTDYAYSGRLGGSTEQELAEELLLSFRNDGAADSPLLCDVSTLDRTWLLPGSAAATLHTNGGSTASTFDYEPGRRDVPLGADMKISPAQGMSSQGVMPWFALELDGPAGGGAVLSLGWTGNWQLRVTRDAQGVRIRASVGDLCAGIHPGEAFRVLRVLLVPIEGAATHDAKAVALRNAMNLHRRVLVDYKVPRKQTDKASFQGALTASWTWGAWPAAALNESGQQQHIAWIDQIGADAWWLDAGWFWAAPRSTGRLGSFPDGIGNWRLPASGSVNSTMFPQGLGPLSAAAKAKGLRSVVWFDVEGVFPGTTIWNMTNDQDLVFRNATSGQRCQLAGQSLLDLGNDRTWQYLLNFSSSAIEEYGIDVFRLDYNVGFDGEPCSMLPCWRAADPPGRSGMAEVRYVQGLYSLWDTLLARFASRDLLIDNCAGGGRRIDLETSSRSVPLWRTDAACPSSEASQAMTMGISVMLPISSGATCGGDSLNGIAPYAWRSAGVVGKAISWGPHTWQAIVSDETQLVRARAAVLETKRIRPIGIEGDYYPLTNATASLSVNVAYQFHRRDQSDGFVYAFHRSAAPAVFSLQLQGVDPTTSYHVHFSRNYSVERTVAMSGAEMRSAVTLSFGSSHGRNTTAPIGSFSPARLQNNTRLWGNLAGPTFHASTFGDCVNGCAKLGTACEGATLQLDPKRTCYPLMQIYKVELDDAPGYASVMRGGVPLACQGPDCEGSMLIEYAPVVQPTGDERTGR